ncbi:MAG: hypothetical protein GF311_21670 [Candidatus Lokiarchaeota archaeon]|nr:hypothetical protein [Candidatus Lokiarchaeota archaeon]
MLERKTEDDQIKELIEICKHTKNYKKIAVVGFMLINNRANELGVKLGIRPRNRENESLYDYLSNINTILTTNFEINLFRDDFLTNLKKYEIIFTKQRGEMPFQYLSEIYELYYELRKLEVPDLWKKVSPEMLPRGISEISFLSSFLSGSSQKEEQDPIQKIILHNFQRHETQLKARLKQKYDPNTFESAILLKRVKTILEQNKSGKILLKGTLKDNIIYKHSLNSTIGFFLLGISILLGMVGVVCLFQAVLFPTISSSLSMIILLFFGSAAFFFYIYWSQFMK